MSGRKIVLMIVVAVISLMGSSQTKAEPIKHQVTGLFCIERNADLRESFEKIPQIKLIKIDFKNAEITVDYDPTKVFPGAKPHQIIERFDNLLKQASHHTFGIRPLRSTPLDKLQWVEVPITGLDCKACSLAAYEAVYKLDGVEQAMASFRERSVAALIDPGKIDRAKLEDALKKRQVDVKAAPK